MCLECAETESYEDGGSVVGGGVTGLGHRIVTLDSVPLALAQKLIPFL